MEERLDTLYFAIGDILSSMDFMRLDEDELESFLDVLVTADEVYTTGVGKSAHVARYFADVLTSTGTVAHFIDPVAAMHGDIGRVWYGAPVIVFSASGATPELLPFLSEIKERNPILLVTCQPQTVLGVDAFAVIDCGPVHEGNALRFPGGSQVAMTLLCAAVAAELVEVKGVNTREYAALHPGGAIGKHLSGLRKKKV